MTKTEQIKLKMTPEQYDLMRRTGKYKEQKVTGWQVHNHNWNCDGMLDVVLMLEKPRTDEVVTISPTAANEIFLELIRMRNQFEESAKKITSLLDKS